MTLSATLLAEFDGEMAITRRMLEAVPAEHLDWKAHEKSYSIGQTASHLANLLTWGTRAITADSFDVSPAKPHPPMPEGSSPAQILEMFDANLAAARQAIENASDVELMANWSLLAGGTPMFTMPKIEVVRSFIVRHSVHHRAQLGVYLRLRDVPLPMSYGPTADLNPF